MRIMFFWIAAIMCAMLGQILQGGHVGSIIQGTSGFIVLGPVFFYLAFAYGVVGFFRFWSRIFTGKLAAEDFGHIDMAATMGFLFGGIGCVLGLIHVMDNLTDTSKLGAGIAVAFVSIVYSALPAMVLLPAKYFSKSKGAKGVSPMLWKSAGYSAASFIFLLLCFFVVLYAESPHKA